MILNIRHTGIVVKDLQRALAFYQDVLGLVVKKDMVEKGPYIDSILGLKNAVVRTVKLASQDGGLIELLCYQEPAPEDAHAKKVHQTGCLHVSFTVSDIEAEHARLSHKGIIFISPPKVSPDGYAKVAFCQDPEGNFIELVELVK